MDILKKKKPAKETLRKNEVLIMATETGYLFHNGDSIVRFRTDEAHDRERKADEFIEPVKAEPVQMFRPA